MPLMRVGKFAYSGNTVSSAIGKLIIIIIIMPQCCKKTNITWLDFASPWCHLQPLYFGHLQIINFSVWVVFIALFVVDCLWTNKVYYMTITMWTPDHHTAVVSDTDIYNIIVCILFWTWESKYFNSRVLCLLMCTRTIGVPAPCKMIFIYYPTDSRKVKPTKVFCRAKC